MTTPHRMRPGGVALVLGVLIFLVSRFRDVVGVPDASLWLLIPVGFGLWIAGLLSFRVRYGRLSRELGRAGLGCSVGGIVLLAVGHVGLLLHLLGPEAVRTIAGVGFVPVLLGTLLLAVGALLFGLDALRGDVLPRLHAAPLLTGLLGLAWIVFANDGRPDGGDPQAFTTMRTLFGLGWLVMALVFATDAAAGGDAPPEDPARRARTVGSDVRLDRTASRRMDHDERQRTDHAG